RRRIELPIKLRNAPATDVALALNTFLQSRRDLLAAQPELISTYELIDKDVVITPEPVSNMLLISAAPSYFDTILKIIKDLDSEPPQVAIQALLVEVELNDTDEFGVELGFQDSTLFNRSVGGIPGFLFNNGNPLG